MADSAGPAGLLLLGGDGPSREVVAPYLCGIAGVVAADSGFDLALVLGLQPDLVVGDFDSVIHRRELDALPQRRIRRVAADKSLTDAELGLEALEELGCSRVIVAGGGGGSITNWPCWACSSVIGGCESGSPAPSTWRR